MNPVFFSQRADGSITKFFEELIEDKAANPTELLKMKEFRPKTAHRQVNEIFKFITNEIVAKKDDNVIDKAVLIVSAHKLNRESLFATLPLELVNEINKLACDNYNYNQHLQLDVYERFKRSKKLIYEIFQDVHYLGVERSWCSKLQCAERESDILDECKKLTDKWNQK